MSTKNELEVLCPTCGKAFKSEPEMLEHYDSEHGQDSATEQAEPDSGKRPVGLTVISAVWLLFGLFNIYSAVQTINIDLENLPYLSGYGVPEWFNMAVPVELTLSVVALCVGLLQVLTIYGLLKGKKYAYKLGLGIPITLPIINTLFVVLYLSAPAGIDLNFNSSVYGGLIGGGIFWAIIYWQYLRKPHVKNFLGVFEEEPPIVQEKEKPQPIKEEEPSLKPQKSSESPREKIGNKKINRKLFAVLAVSCLIIIIGTVGYIATMPSDSKNTDDAWTINNYSLDANSQYTITLTAKDGYSFESWRYVTSTHWASTEYNTTQTTLTVSGDQMSLNAYFVPKDQSGKGSTASITLQTTTSMQLDLEVRYGAGTVVQAFP